MHGAPRGVTHPAIGQTLPAVRSVSDLLALFIGAADDADLAIVDGSASHRGFKVLLPDGAVEISLRFPAHVPLTTEDPRPTGDNFPMIRHGNPLALFDGAGDDDRGGSAGGTLDTDDMLAAMVQGFEPHGIDPND